MQSSRKLSSIPLVVDVIRMIDGYEMVRCAYYSIESETPLLDTEIEIEGKNNPFLFIQMEAIFLGSPDRLDHFNSTSDIDAMYEFAERHDGIFVDINDVWVPLTWFDQTEIKSGMVFRIPIDKFISCWKFRHNHIAVEVFLAEEIKEIRTKQKALARPYLVHSKGETSTFEEWTQQQISQSREIYQNNRDNYLQKIKS
ncbi:MAG: hypothetical protein HKN76_16210 [Saprospiraceae bacterium]|nr:hypothetical protein [Saprospiraceae bacterium]